MGTFIAPGRWFIAFGRDVPQQHVIDNAGHNRIGKDRNPNDGEQPGVSHRGPGEIATHCKRHDVNQAGLDGEVAEVLLGVKRVIGNFRPDLSDNGG